VPGEPSLRPTPAVPRDRATSSRLSPNCTLRPFGEFGSADADRIQRRVIRFAGIIFSHAGTDSFQLQHVKTNVNILIAYLLRAGTGAFPRANLAAMPVRALNRSTLTLAGKRPPRTQIVMPGRRAKAPPRPVEPWRRLWLPFDSWPGLSAGPSPGSVTQYLATTGVDGQANL
jgi:hypothetical protein